MKEEALDEDENKKKNEEVQEMENERTLTKTLESWNDVLASNAYIS